MSNPEVVAEALRWLRFAKEDLSTAAQLLDEDPHVPRHVCLLAQQIVEKALKAALVLEGVDFPFRHDLDALRNLLPDSWVVRREHPDLAELTEWAIEARYPSDWPEATVEDAERATAQARALYGSIVREFARRGVELNHTTRSS